MLAKTMYSSIKEKNFPFQVLEASAETLIRSGRKTQYRLTAYFLVKIAAKNTKVGTCFLKLQWQESFSETVYI